MSLLQDANSCREMFETLPEAFLPDVAGDMEAIFQFNISDPENFTSHIKIKDSQVTLHEGPAEDPDVTVHSPPDIWLQVVKGELDGATAVMMGQFSFDGELSLLLELKKIFGTA